MPWIKKVYLYVVSLVALIMLIIAAVTLINMGLKVALHAEDNYGYPTCMAIAPAPDSKTTAVCDQAEQQREEEARKKQQTQQRKSDVAHSLAMIIVGVPVFWYHWKLARKEA